MCFICCRLVTAADPQDRVSTVPLHGEASSSPSAEQLEEPPMENVSEATAPSSRNNTWNHVFQCMDERRRELSNHASISEPGAAAVCQTDLLSQLLTEAFGRRVVNSVSGERYNHRHHPTFSGYRNPSFALHCLYIYMRVCDTCLSENVSACPTAIVIEDSSSEASAAHCANVSTIATETNGDPHHHPSSVPPAAPSTTTSVSAVDMDTIDFPGTDGELTVETDRNDAVVEPEQISPLRTAEILRRRSFIGGNGNATSAKRKRLIIDEDDDYDDDDGNRPPLCSPVSSHHSDEHNATDEDGYCVNFPR